METLQPILREHQFLRGLDEKYLEFLTGCASNLRFKAQEFLFREGEEASAMYLLRSGRVALEVDIPGQGSVQIQSVEEGEVLGFAWLFSPYRWQFDGRAVEPVRAIAFDGRCLREKCEADHDLGYEIVKRFLHQVYQRLDRARFQMLDVYRKHP
jgi:CRP/FNR family cyclic AMP-dependent transcriptional regulator